MQNTSVDNRLDIGTQNDKSHGSSDSIASGDAELDMFCSLEKVAFLPLLLVTRN